jgi:hypothetical protein
MVVIVITITDSAINIAVTEIGAVGTVKFWVIAKEPVHVIGRV